MESIELREVTKTYYYRGKDFAAVADLSLEIPRGTVFGFLGPNGAGKTTTMKMLVGLTTPDKGEVKIFGEPPRALSVKKKIGFMPETPGFYRYLTAREFLGFVADIFNLDRRTRASRMQDLLKKVRLDEFPHMPSRQYSKGMLQRLSLAQALMNDPEVLFLDEPLDGLDPIGRAEAKDLLLELKRGGKTIFFNSHILADVEDMCDAVGIIDGGRLVTHGSVSDIMRGFRNLEEAFVAIIRKNRNTA